MSALLRLGALVLAAGLPAAALAQAAPPACPDTDPRALAWLDRMSHSAQNISYHGVVTLQQGDNVQFLQMSHSVTGEGSSENMTRLTGQGARVERHEHPLHCVHPGHKLLRVGAALQEGNCGIAEHYRFNTAEGERVAGRSAVRILVQPRDMYRYGYVMELDQETALLLKARVIGPGNRVLERFQFADLSFDDDAHIKRDSEVVHQARHPHPGISMADDIPSRSWQVRWLPGGFTATDGAAGADARRTYTDGLAVFSVFLEEVDIRPGEGVVRQGSTISYTRGMQLGGDSVLVTVLGEVPLNTARMVADSVAWSE